MMELRSYWLFMWALLVIDCGWGMAQVRGLVPLWSFILLNFPSSLPCIWMESHWVGTPPAVGGHTVSELWSLGLFGFMVVAQELASRLPAPVRTECARQTVPGLERASQLNASAALPRFQLIGTLIPSLVLAFYRAAFCANTARSRGVGRKRRRLVLAAGFGGYGLRSAAVSF
jgi:hypothetical protein